MKMTGLFRKVLPGANGRRPQETKQAALAVRALDDFRDRALSAPTHPRDRYTYDRNEVLQDALEAWRVNPLARRIVELTSQYVIGGGLSVECDHEHTHRFINEWWHHRLNRMDIRCFEWCDELSRSGELFLLLSSDASGMSYLRAIPAADILEIETAGNDVEQELRIFEKPDYADPEANTTGADGLLYGRNWEVYDEQADRRLPTGGFKPVMLHYAVNRPVGAKHGESDLAPLLRWLARYSNWLEDRARLNRFRNTFVYWVKARFASAEERLRRQAELNANPPNPGSILVSDESESWEILSPNLASFEAAEDGLAMKKMISAGAGAPLHFLAEPESSTRTTAESAGGPTFRHYQQRQYYFLWMIEDLAKIAIRRRRMVDRRISGTAVLKVYGSDISGRDNASLATAASTITGALVEVRRNGLIDDAELLRMLYKFAGEMTDVEEMLRRGRAAGPWKDDRPSESPGAGRSKLKPAGIELDPITGEPKGIDRV